MGFRSKIEVPETFQFGSYIEADNDRMVISSAVDSSGLKKLYTFDKVGDNWEFQGITELGDLETHYYSFTLSNGQLFVIRDNAFDVNENSFSNVEIMDYDNGSWHYSDDFEVFEDDQLYSEIRVEGDRMFVGSYGYVLATSRRFPLRYFVKVNDAWQYQSTFQSEGPAYLDDYFGLVMASDQYGLIVKGEFQIFGPQGKSYYIDFATLGLNENSVTDFEIYPNPSLSILNIYNPTGKFSSNLQVLSVTGLVLINQSGAVESIDISGLSSGMNFLQIEFNDGTKATKRFIRS